MDGGQPNKRVRLMGDHRVRVSSSSDSENDEGVGNTFGDPPDELSPPGSPPPDSPPSSGGSSSSSSSETSSSEDEVDDDDVSNLQDYSDELLVFAYKMLTRARSESEELEIFELATLVMDGMNRFNYADYKRLKAQLIEDSGYEKIVLCKICGTNLAHLNALCGNRACPLVRKRLRRSVRQRRIVIETMNLRRHFRSLLAKNIEKILQSHGEVHNSDASERKDCRFFPNFRESIESTRSFEEGKLIVPVSVGTDGEAWPVMFQLLSLPPYLRLQYSNMGFPITVTGGGKPNEFVWRLIVGRLATFFDQLQATPFRIPSSLGIVEITLSIFCSQMDAAAASHVYGLNGWTGYCGCPYCVLPGLHTGGRMVYPLLQDAALRTTDYTQRFCVFADAANLVNGFRANTSFLRLCPPTKLVPDALHVLQEGIEKDWMRDSIKRSGRRGLATTANGRRFLTTLSASMFPNGAAKVFTSECSDLSVLTGSEAEMVFVNVFAILSFNTLSFVDPYHGTLFACLALWIRKVQKRTFDEVYAEEVATLLEEIICAIDSCFGDTHSSYKHHTLEHIPKFLREVGCVYELGTSSLESSYRLQKNSVPMSNTRRQGGVAMTTHSSLTSLRSVIEPRANLGSICCVSLVTSLHHSSFDKVMKSRQPLNGPVFVSDRDLMQRVRRGAHQNLEEMNSLTLLSHAAPGFDTVYKRVLYDGDVYESFFHPDPRRKETQRCYLIVETDNQTLVPARFEFCAANDRGEAVVAVQTFDSTNPFQRLRRDLFIRMNNMPVFRTPANENVLDLLRSCMNANDVYFEFNSIQGTRCVYRIDRIKGPAQVGCVGGRSFAIDCKSKVFHE